MSITSPGAKLKQHERDRLQAEVDQWVAEGNTITQLAPGESVAMTLNEVIKNRTKANMKKRRK